MPGSALPLLLTVASESSVLSFFIAAEEIVSPKYLEIYRRLGAEIRVIDWIPRTEFTEKIPGGKESFWGYSLNRIV